MQFRRFLAVGTAILVAAGLGCSKTQDTAPESRLFGAPPAITGVDVSLSTASVSCDVTDVIRGFFCGDFPDFVITFQNPAIRVSGTYSRVLFKVQASDPDSTASSNDILLTSASYVTTEGGEVDEVSLVLLDDGSSNLFDSTQKGTHGEACKIDQANGMCGCGLATYKLASNDGMAGDGTYSRTFAFVVPGGQGYPAGFGGDILQNCIQNANREAPAAGGGFIGRPIEFKIEATDRSGNLTAWPVKPAINIATTTYDCTGDECACCLMREADPFFCGGKPGSMGPPGSGFESGYCLQF
jgi:hypothetical protein